MPTRAQALVADRQQLGDPRSSRRPAGRSWWTGQDEQAGGLIDFELTLPLLASMAITSWRGC